jgi:hypothetical protein
VEIRAARPAWPKTVRPLRVRLPDALASAAGEIVRLERRLFAAYCARGLRREVPSSSLMRKRPCWQRHAHVVVP